jgi:localization factor PodJL
MTTVADLRAGAQSGQQRPSGQQGASASEPTAIQFKMPRQSDIAQAPAQDTPQPGPISSLENLLQGIMTRLDEIDRRYGQALNRLNQRLNDLSERALSARAGTPESSGTALDRLHHQATSLAAQVSEAGSAREAAARNYYELQPGGSANDDNPRSGFGSDALRDDVTHVSQRLERSLATTAPASEFDALSRRMDELGQRFNSALSNSQGAESLQAIEAQLNALTAGFNEARQNYARVSTIEENVERLIQWAQSGNLDRGQNDDARLSTIEQTLQALERNACEMDTRTVGTLEAMNDALHLIAARNGESDSQPVPRSDKKIIAPQKRADPPHAASHSSEPESEVRIEERYASESGPITTDDRIAALEAEIGASIPDYQPSTRVSGKRTSQQPNAEGETESEFIESARRAAAAAAQEPARKSQKVTGGIRSRLKKKTAPTAPHDPDKPRRLLYFASAGLLALSAGLLYVRLKSPTPDPQPPVSQQSLPDAPQKRTQDSSGDSAPTPKPASPKKEQSSLVPRDGMDGEQPRGAVPDDSQREQPASAPPDEKRENIRPRRAKLDFSVPLSTATFLASLQPVKPREQLPGVSIFIKEPARVPASHTASLPRPATPALGPPRAQNAPAAALAQPMRAPASRRQTTNASDIINSAPAKSGDTPASGLLRTSAIPPARIGPNSLRVAAARGHPAAQFEVASRYAKGKGVPKDLKTAAEWYDRAAAQGFAPGQYRLAALYERGYGVKKDLSIARTWYRRAAELGNVRAMHNLAVLYTRSDGQKPDYMAARNWFSLAARHGLANSQFNLAILYEFGLGTAKNITEAYKWFSLAAKQGDTEAAKRREAVRPQLPARALSAVEKTISNWKGATPKDEANRIGPPRGGWQVTAPPAVSPWTIRTTSSSGRTS